MKRNILLLLALILLVLPASAKRKKVSDVDRAAAIAEMVDMLKTERWTLYIDHINSTRVNFTQLIPERNYIYIEDGRLVIQTDKTSSFVMPNMVPRSHFFGSGRAQREFRMAMLPVYRQVYDVVITETALNRKGTKIYYTITMKDPHGRTTRQRMTIDPVSLTASVGVYSGRIEPLQEVTLSMPEKR